MRILMFSLVLLVFCGGALTQGVTVPRRNPGDFTARQWRDVFSVANQLPFPQRIAFWADLIAIDSSYVADPLGEGPGKPPDPDPLFDFAHVDCVTYIEQVYALALSSQYDSFPAHLQDIRYARGQVDFRWRNHYFVSDWLPANAWFIKDITTEVGPGITETMTKTISRGAFFRDKGLAQYADLPDETGTTCYIPRQRLADVRGLRTGDTVIFVISTPGIIAGHTGLIRLKNGVPYLQHASLTAKEVVTVPLAEYLRNAPARFVGFKIARPMEMVR